MNDVSNKKPPSAISHPLIAPQSLGAPNRKPHRATTEVSGLSCNARHRNCFSLLLPLDMLAFNDEIENNGPKLDEVQLKLKQFRFPSGTTSGSHQLGQW